MKYLIVQAYWYFDQVTGEYNYRIKKPGDILRNHPDYEVINVHVFHPLFSQVALAADLVILHLLPDYEIRQLITLRKKMGKPTLFEIADNFLSLGPWVPEDDAHRHPETRQNLLSHAALSDGLQFSTVEVQKTFGFLNRVKVVFENQIEFTRKIRPYQAPFTFGWGGSRGHEEDLAEVAPAIKAFLQDKPGTVFSYMGHHAIFQRLFEDLPRDRAHFRPAGSLEEYYDFLQTLHVGIAPLRDTEFNRCRSDVKFLEYAAMGVVPILADVPAYRAHGVQGQNALFFKNPFELIEQLTELCEHPDQIGELAAKAQRYMSTKRSLDNHLTRRISFYQSLLRHQPMLLETPSLPDCTGLIAYLRKATHFFSQGEWREGLRILDQLLQLHTTYHQAHYWRARCLQQLGEHQTLIKEYESATFDPVYWDLMYELLAGSAKQLGQPKWREFLSRVADPVRRLRLEAEPKVDVEIFCDQILKLSPFDYEALVQLGMLRADRNPADPGALDLIRRARFIDPDNLQLLDLEKALEKASLVLGRPGIRIGG